MDLLGISAETNVVEVYRLTVDTHDRRGNPVGKLTWLCDTAHQAAHISAVFVGGQPLAHFGHPLFAGDHTAIGCDFGTRQRTDVAVESFVRGCELEGDASLFNHTVPTLNALNEVLRDDYITDSKGGIERWNRVIEKAGISFKLTAPHKAFHRNIGSLSGSKITPDGRVVTSEEWMSKVGEWLPTNEDRAYVGSLMGRVTEPGKFANWIAPPVMGINRQPVDFDYVRFS